MLVFAFSVWVRKAGTRTISWTPEKGSEFLTFFRKSTDLLKEKKRKGIGFLSPGFCKEQKKKKSIRFIVIAASGEFAWV